VTRRLALGGMPLHPALVHVPITPWLAALPGMLAGAPDAFASRDLVEAEGTVWRHAGLMAASWRLFAMASLLAAAENPQRSSTIVAASNAGS